MPLIEKSYGGQVAPCPPLAASAKEAKTQRGVAVTKDTKISRKDLARRSRNQILCGSAGRGDHR